MRIDTSAVPAEMAEQCRDTGVHFAAEEFGNFQDAGRARCPWTWGTYEGGDLPIQRPGDDAEDFEAQEELACACEKIMDDAASVEWERLWDEITA